MSIGPSAGAMIDAVRTLTEREKETLRLLLAGHDAKSIARDLGLSVHTVNDRLRDARRKLGVSSSREAARLLHRAEGGTPEILAPAELGIAVAMPADADSPSPGRWRSGDRPLFWLGGGMLIMSFIILAAMLSSGLAGTERARPLTDSAPVAIAPGPTVSAAVASAKAWATLLDRQQWDASWDASGALFRSQLAKADWATTIRSVRQPLGTVASRTIQSATRTNALPGAPAGDYAIIVFTTNFAAKPKAVETVIMAREGMAWKVISYFIR